MPGTSEESAESKTKWLMHLMRVSAQWIHRVKKLISQNQVPIEETQIQIWTLKRPYLWYCKIDFSKSYYIVQIWTTIPVKVIVCTIKNQYWQQMAQVLNASLGMLTQRLWTDQETWWKWSSEKIQ